MNEHKVLSKFTTTMVQLFDRSIKPVKKLEFDIMTNDIDNLYPNRLEIIEKQSSTARGCSLKLAQYLIGKGFDLNSKPEVLVKTKGGRKINQSEMLEMVVNSVRTHQGAFIHLNYNIEGDINYFDVLDYKRCRVVKSDDNGFNGIVVDKDWTLQENSFKFNTKANSYKWFYPFNRDNVIAQRLKDNPKSTIEEQIRTFRGQVFLFKFDYNEVYPNGWLTAQGMNDANSEFQLSLYTNNNLRNGFIDKTMFLVQGVDKEGEEDFKSSIKGMFGAENAGSTPIMFMEGMVDNLDVYIKTIQLKSSFEPNKFEKTHNSIIDSIRLCYGIPSILLNTNDSGVFGNSGELLKQAQLLYSNELAPYRKKLENLFFDLFGFDYKIIPLRSEF